MKSSGRITLSGLSFKKGEKLEVIVFADEKRSDLVREMKSLFKETQKLPAIKKIIEADIIKEIRDYRSGI
jgi:hypothetical protein